MDRLVYTALTGLRRAEYAQGLTSANLANASTTGFQRDVGTFGARWLEGTDGPTRVQASEQIASTELEAGPVTATGGALDIALGGTALLAVEPRGGGEGYTRRGDLKLTETRALVTGDGRPVLGASGPITLPPADAVRIAPDGTVSVVAPGAAPGDWQAADTLRLVTFDGSAMRKREDGLLRRLDGAPAAPDPAARLTPGALEGSNVSSVASLVQLIEQSRAFELSTRLVQTARELDAASAALMRLE